MCGILAIFRSTIEKHQLKKLALNSSKKLRHRGPDWNGIVIEENDDGSANIIAHERLSIVDVLSGKQPLFDDEKEICLTINGEIYNHIELRKLIKEESLNKLTSASDCAIIPNLYKIYKEKMLTLLDGIFAGVISDKKNKTFFAFRDPIGVCPLYIGYSSDGSTYFASELKALANNCLRYVLFPPGHYYININNESKFVRYYNPNWWNINCEIPNNKVDYEKLREYLENAVIKRLMADVPFGLLLSGGLDSSIIAAIMAKHVKRIQSSDTEKNKLLINKINSFSIGLKDSRDLAAAKEVANYLGLVHNEFHFTIEDGIDALHDVIYHVETYDITTVRSSVPMYLLSRLIKSFCIKVVLSGEGSDEIFGGYLYFHKAPNKVEFHRELQRKIHDLHYYDALRANKSSMAFGVEVRFPFLDLKFLDYSMNIDPSDKMCSGNKIEKEILRNAFKGYLPDHILYRQKEQFSDGVGYSWIDGLKEYAEKKISDIQFSKAPFLFPYNTPKTKEGFLYRSIFAEIFHEQCAHESVPESSSIACSTSIALEWDDSFKKNADQSGRSVLGIHKEAKQFEDVLKAAVA